MQPSLESLFTRYRTTGHPEPLGDLFDRVGPRLLALALHLCGHPADAEDALQATFVAAIDQRSTWQADRPLLPWLRGILDRQCRRIGQRRLRRRERELPDEPSLLDDGTPLQASERRELVARVRDHVDRLPVEQRQVLLLQLEHGLAPAEVAEVLGVPPGTVRMRLHRAVQALRGVLPAGLVALLLTALPSRGVAAVRAEVLGHAATAAVGGGALLKKLALAAAVLLGTFAAVLVVPPWRVAPNAPPEGRGVERAVVHEPAVAPGGDEAAAGDGAARQEVAAAPAGAASPSSDAGGTLVVRVRHAATRRPVPAMPLRVWPARCDVDARSTGRAAATGADGVAHFVDLAPGDVHVGAAMDGTWTATIVAGRSSELALEVPESVVARRVDGVVRHADGRAAPGATIVAGPCYQDFVVPVAAADAAGAFTVELPFVLPAVGARLTGCQPTPLLHLGRTDGPIELWLPGAEARVTGCVVGADGVPVSGAWLEVGASRRTGTWCDARGDTRARSPGRELQTDAAGRFAADGLPAGDVELLVRADGFAPFHRYVTLAAGHCTEVRCELAVGAAIAGRVVDTGGVPVAGVQVCLGGVSSERRTTDAAGRFGFRHVRPGAQQVRVEGEDVLPAHCERTADVSAPWQVVVTRVPRYRLRVVDDRGAPLAGWNVALQSTIRRDGELDADGRIVLAAAGTAPFELRLGAPGTEPVVTVPWPAAVPDVETTVVLPASARPEAVLAGDVVDTTGRPWAGGWLSLRGSDGSSVRQEPVVGAAFRLAELPAGDWTLCLQCAQAGAVLARVPVRALRAGEQRRLGTLRLPLLGTVHATVQPPPGVPLDRPALFLHDADGGETQVPLDGDGTVAVPAGRYRWTLFDENALWQRGELTVAAGETTALAVALQRGVRRAVVFPVPAPAWGTPQRVDYVLRAPDGSAYLDGSFDPRDELPYRLVPTVCVGTWRLELVTDDGRRFAGAFEVTSLAPSRTPFELAVAPAR